MKIITTAGNHPLSAIQVSDKIWNGPCLSGVYEEVDNDHEIWFIKFKNKEQRNEFLTDNPNIKILWEQNIDFKKQTVEESMAKIDNVAMFYGHRQLSEAMANFFTADQLQKFTEFLINEGLIV